MLAEGDLLQKQVQIRSLILCLCLSH